MPALPSFSVPVFAGLQTTAVMSMSQAALHLQPEQVVYIPRIEDRDGVLKLTAIKQDKTEVSGVPLTSAWARSFPLLWSVILGKLPAVDIAFLNRDLPTWYWGTWLEAVAYLRDNLPSVSGATRSILHAEVISGIPVPEVADAVRTLLTTDPNHFSDMVNGDVTPLSKGKVVLSLFWFRVSVYKWVAKQHKKKLSWEPKATEQSGPAGGVGEKVLERAIRDAWPNSSGLLPRDIPASLSSASGQSSAGPSTAGASEDLAAKPSGELSAGIALPSETASKLTMPQILLKVAEASSDVPSEYVKKAVEHLNTLLSPYPATHKLGQQLLRVGDGPSLSTCLTSFSWPSGNDQVRIKCALMSWVRYLNESELIVITDSVKSQTTLAILKQIQGNTDADTKWRSLACQIAVDIAALEEQDIPVFHLESVKDFATLAVAIAEFVGDVRHLSVLKALQTAVSNRCKHGAAPNWTASVLSQLGIHTVPSVSPGPTSLPASQPYPADPASLTAVRMTLSPNADGLPWPAFVSAASAFFQCAVHGPHSPAGLMQRGVSVKFCSLLIPTQAWRQRLGMDGSVVIVMAPHLTASLSACHPDGSPVRPWTPPTQCVCKQWGDSLRPPPSSKRAPDEHRFDERPTKRHRAPSRRPPTDGPPPPYAARSPSPGRLSDARHSSYSDLPPSLQDRRASYRDVDRDLSPRGSPSPPRPAELRPTHRDPRYVPRFGDRDRESSLPAAGSWETSSAYHGSQAVYRGHGNM